MRLEVVLWVGNSQQPGQTFVDDDGLVLYPNGIAISGYQVWHLGWAHSTDTASASCVQMGKAIRNWGFLGRLHRRDSLPIMGFVALAFREGFSSLAAGSFRSAIDCSVRLDHDVSWAVIIVWKTRWRLSEGLLDERKGKGDG